MKTLVLFSVMMIMTTGYASASKPFAVVELFSSEGCSSCPPADELLSQIGRQSRGNNERVYTLSFQVDYWDYLGWKDPASKHEFTERQHQYAETFGSSSVFTPQMIVNGRDAFVGTDRAKAQDAIAKHLKALPFNNIYLTLNDKTVGQLEVFYVCERVSPDAVVHVALVESGIESRVTAGENSGLLLKHEHIVQEFKTVPLDQKYGKVVLTLPSVQHMDRYEVIAYVQNTKDMSILAADHIPAK